MVGCANELASYRGHHGHLALYLVLGFAAELIAAFPYNMHRFSKRDPASWPRSRNLGSKLLFAMYVV